MTRNVERAVLAFWGWRLLAALTIATPLALALGVGGAATTAGDQDLFAPGLLVASDVLRGSGPALSAALKSGLVTWFVLGVLGLMPLAALLSALHEPGQRPLREHFSRAARFFPTFLSLSGTLLLAQFACLLASSLLGSGLGATLGHRGRAPALAPLAVYAVGFAGALLLGVVVDLARAAAVRHDCGARAALSRALASFRQRAGAACAGYFASASGSVLAVLIAALVVQRLDVSRPGGWRVAAVLAVHQLVIALLVLLRVRWLGRAHALTGD
jgi:hypothetical protein